MSTEKHRQNYQYHQYKNKATEHYALAASVLPLYAKHQHCTRFKVFLSIVLSTNMKKFGEVRLCELRAACKKQRGAKMDGHKKEIVFYQISSTCVKYVCVSLSLYVCASQCIVVRTCVSLTACV